MTSPNDHETPEAPPAPEAPPHWDCEQASAWSCGWDAGWQAGYAAAKALPRGVQVGNHNTQTNHF